MTEVKADTLEASFEAFEREEEDVAALRGEANHSAIFPQLVTIVAIMSPKNPTRTRRTAMGAE